MTNIYRAENLIDDLLNKLDIPNETYGNISVCVVEAVSNAIIHGNKNDVTKIVLLSYKYNDGTLVFTIADEGDGFDLDRIPDPTLPENLESFSGRGVFLINHLSDDITYTNNGALLSIEFNI